MLYYYSRIPAAAVFTMFDGKTYARIPHSIQDGTILENFEAPRMLRFCAGSFIENGEAYILFGKRGNAIPVKGFVPFGVSVIEARGF